MITIKPWWEQHEGRLEHELQALKDAGIRYEQDQETRQRHNRIRLVLTVTVDGEHIDLIADYPDLYPYIRFEVTAPKLELDRHQNPFGKNLCLIGRETKNWKPSNTLVVQRDMRTAVW